MASLNQIEWNIRSIRPNKVPGSPSLGFFPNERCNDSSPLKRNCYLFDCQKCSTSLALKAFDPAYERGLQCVPRISSIPKPEVFEEVNKYHGEVEELYFKYFAQLSDFANVAINGWSNLDAVKVFKNVDRTFEENKIFEKTKVFELDWLIFNGHSITFVELKEKSERAKSGANKNFE